MPSKNSLFEFPDRNYIFNMSFYKKNLVEEKKIELSFEDCKNIIETANKNIAKAIEEEIDGFKLPYGLGYLATKSYEPKQNYVNWLESKRLGKIIYHLNLHTFGKACTVKWFRVGRIDNIRFHEVFKFKGYKTLGLSISKAFKAGKDYQGWEIADFIEKGRLENLYNKKYRTELND